MKISRHSAAFTLIELLVVISIIAILAGIATPVFAAVMINGRQAAALASAKQIALALRVYASDHDGAYPATRNTYDEEILTANDAFRSLFPAYLDNEKVFTVGGSKAGATADNRMDEPAQMLTRGENHWAYVEGLNTSSNSNWPLLVDHTDGSGTFGKQEGELGGTWKGTKAIVVRTDGSGAIEPLLGGGDKRYLPRFNDKSKNALQLADYMGESVRLLEPAL
jgi:prepilin-type N-terminal cleavage/methylation domain-containing protein